MAAGERMDVCVSCEHVGRLAVLHRFPWKIIGRRVGVTLTLANPSKTYTLESRINGDQWSAQAGVQHFVWSALEDVRQTPGEAGTPCACSMHCAACRNTSSNCCNRANQPAHAVYTPAVKSRAYQTETR